MISKNYKGVSEWNISLIEELCYDNKNKIGVLTEIARNKILVFALTHPNNCEAITKIIRAVRRGSESLIDKLQEIVQGKDTISLGIFHTLHEAGKIVGPKENIVKLFVKNPKIDVNM